MKGKNVAVVGATGFIGRHLVPILRFGGHKVIAVSRKPPTKPTPGVEFRRADVLDSASLPFALKDIDTAFYLVHSMQAPKGSSFVEMDRQAAKNFISAAQSAGIRRVIYLGGLGETGPGISEHLESRAEVGRILQSTAIPTTVLRAAIILGAGGASWEMLRQLVDRLPLMVTPRWLETRCQPIALKDVLGYLAGCLDTDATVGNSFDIGGPDILTYRQMMMTLARMMGKKRLILPIPVLTPHLSSYWVNFVTDVPAAIATPLIEGLKNEVICRENRIREIISLPLTPYREAVVLALEGRV